MGCPCEVLVDTDDTSLASELAALAANEAWRIEDKFSRYLPDNVVAAINDSNGAPVEVDEETAGLLDFAEKLYELSEQRFDITSGALRRVWRFDGGNSTPNQSAIDAVMRNVGWHRLSWQRPFITLQPGMEIDLGGVGKEYAVDRAAAAVAAGADVSCLVNFGGDLAITASHHDATGWQVGIEVPDANDRLAQRLIRLKAGGMATSGDSRRYVLAGGHRYGHILDARNGWPVNGAPRSITVAADTCTEAGTFATLAMLRGEEAENFLQSEGVQFWIVR